MKFSDSKPHLERRRFLKILSAGVFLTLPVGWTQAEESNLWLPDDLPLTPRQVKGPFYPVPSIEQQIFNDTDLTRKLPDHALADGQIVDIEGIVRDRKGRTLANTVVEIWQASEDGLYNHPNDAAEDPELDANFQYWGRFITGEDGAYRFKTIVPGEYQGRSARHIHFRVASPGYRELITQSYFSMYGERNTKDALYRRLNKQARELLTVEFNDTGGGGWKGTFNIVLAED